MSPLTHSYMTTPTQRIMSRRSSHISPISSSISSPPHSLLALMPSAIAKADHRPILLPSRSSASLSHLPVLKLKPAPRFFELFPSFFPQDAVLYYAALAPAKYVMPPTSIVRILEPTVAICKMAVLPQSHFTYTQKAPPSTTNQKNSQDEGGNKEKEKKVALTLVVVLHLSIRPSSTEKKKPLSPHKHVQKRSTTGERFHISHSRQKPKPPSPQISPYKSS
jgi:hypothetical protein